MRNSHAPKTIVNWINRNKDKVDDWWMEEDSFAGDDNPWSIWLYLSPGWTNSATDTHIIHEATVADFMEMTTFLERCRCSGCTGRPFDATAHLQ